MTMRIRDDLWSLAHAETDDRDAMVEALAKRFEKLEALREACAIAIPADEMCTDCGGYFADCALRKITRLAREAREQKMAAYTEREQQEGGV